MAGLASGKSSSSQNFGTKAALKNAKSDLAKSENPVKKFAEAGFARYVSFKNYRQDILMKQHDAEQKCSRNISS